MLFTNGGWSLFSSSLHACYFFFLFFLCLKKKKIISDYTPLIPGQFERTFATNTNEKQSELTGFKMLRISGRNETISSSIKEIFVSISHSMEKIILRVLCTLLCISYKTTVWKLLLLNDSKVPVTGLGSIKLLFLQHGVIDYSNSFLL